MRLFLNSLFESPCSTADGLPKLELLKQAPAFVDTPGVTFDITYKNSGAMTALDAVLTDTLPPGVTFVSATDDGVFADGTVTWQLGNLGEGEGGAVSVTVDLDAYGTYANTATLAYRAGVNELSLASEPTNTEYGPEMSTTGGTGSSAGTGDTTGADTAGTSATGTGGSASATATSDSATGDEGPTGGTPTEGSAGTGDASGGATGTDSGTGGASTDTGCGCRGQGDAGGLGLLLGLTALGLRPRRRTARRG